jgi:hypothetical protein
LPIADHCRIANMKKLMNAHKESILKYTTLEWNRIINITYLYEFDREVQ